MLGMMSFYLVCALLGLVAVLLVHELGHVTAARLCGVRVLRVNAGLGPELAGLTDRHGTRWSLGILPIGASAIMFDKTHSVPAGLVTVDMLSSKSLAQRAGIYAAGPLFSLLLAFALFGTVTLFENLAAKSFESPTVMVATLLGQFSLLVAAFQMVPILPLDGGWLFLFAGEAVTGRATSELFRRRLRAVGLAVIIVLEITVTGAALHVGWTTLAG